MAVALAALAASLFGTVVRAPAAPVCLAGSACTAPAAHVTLVFRRGVVVRHALTDAHGAYHITLAPGTYAVRMQGQSRIAHLTPATVTVRGGAPARRNFSFDSGIR
jgi:hypothetical protein